MLRVFLIAGFAASLGSFSLMSHPVGCCFLLLLASLLLSFFVFSLVGSSWYVLLFCLVYVGGIFILFVYASLFSPNLFTGMGYSLYWVVLFFFFFCALFKGLFWSFGLLGEHSHYLCSLIEGSGYCFFCVILLLGFCVVSAVSSCSTPFFR